MTTWLESFLFVGIPYGSLAMLISAGLHRLLRDRRSLVVGAGQFLAPHGHFPATGLLHYGVTAVLLVHGTALLLPWVIRWWNSSPYRLYALEVATFGAGLIVVTSLVLALERHFSRPRLRVRRRWTDMLALSLLLLQAVTGLATAVISPWGIAWMTHAGSPYLASVLRFDPVTAFPASAPWLLKVHIVNGMVLVALLPFTSLGHAVLVPLKWLVRPPLVYRSKRSSPLG